MQSTEITAAPIAPNMKKFSYFFDQSGLKIELSDEF